MVDGYVILISNKLANIERVPAHLKSAVMAKLNALGLEGYGNPLETE